MCISNLIQRNYSANIQMSYKFDFIYIIGIVTPSASPNLLDIIESIISSISFSFFRIIHN